MRNLSRISLALAASAALVGSIALPASAADSDTTDTTVTVSAGELSIAAPATAPLGAVVPGATATITLGDVVVTDLRAGTLGWEATVDMTSLTGTGGTISASNASYTTAEAAAGGAGTVTLTKASSLDLSTPTVVQTATNVSGNHTATWGADLKLTPPANALAGDYTGTLTHSFL